MQQLDEVSIFNVGQLDYVLTAFGEAAEEHSAEVRRIHSQDLNVKSVVVSKTKRTDLFACTSWPSFTWKTTSLLSFFMLKFRNGTHGTPCS